LIVWKVVIKSKSWICIAHRREAPPLIERVTIIEFRVDNGGGNGAGCFEVKVWAGTAKFTNVIVAGFRNCRELV